MTRRTPWLEIIWLGRVLYVLIVWHALMSEEWVVVRIGWAIAAILCLGVSEAADRGGDR